MVTAKILQQRFEVIQLEFADISRYNNFCWPGLIERWNKNLRREHNYWCNLNQLKLREFGQNARKERQKYDTMSES